MSARRFASAALSGAALAVGLAAWACAPGETQAKPANSTLIVGIDVSGSFRSQYEDAIEFASYYIYGHLHGLGGLRTPTALFVGSVGGDKPGEPKAFHPINDFQTRTRSRSRRTCGHGSPRATR